VSHLDTMRELPPHIVALQLLVDRCETSALKKELIVMAAGCGAIDRHEGFLMVTANQLETA
jgi:hypothetical protein